MGSLILIWFSSIYIPSKSFLLIFFTIGRRATANSFTLKRNSSESWWQKFNRFLIFEIVDYKVTGYFFYVIVISLYSYWLVIFRVPNKALVAPGQLTDFINLRDFVKASRHNIKPFTGPTPTQTYTIAIHQPPLPTCTIFRDTIRPREGNIALPWNICTTTDTYKSVCLAYENRVTISNRSWKSATASQTPLPATDLFSTVRDSSSISTTHSPYFYTTDEPLNLS